MHKTNCPVSQGKITYATLPDGTADVWIRKNETQLPESEEGPQGVEADEIYFKVTVDTVTKEEIVALSKKIKLNTIYLLGGSNAKKTNN